MLSWISNKEVLFMFPTNKVATEDVPLEQKVVQDVCRLNSCIYLHN